MKYYLVSEEYIKYLAKEYNAIAYCPDVEDNECPRSLDCTPCLIEWIKEGMQEFNIDNKEK